ncbi:LOW QUALITY PROTEIN: probable ATP-dependent RNA helicase spindle-E [Pollicipes pollicipes]|uniref:LOW QUALITY PROTEIN: probable ATP-dependent RNA helicase spindle-E n=1 Tax=Pollicipes pollicipes TaxID=41117 RepID=UPI0018854A25|nr:LOW QUALITY PROTEIN: probable ATP-dependent RNA helicase spindle-E [Pollicipes pollicipes]
MVEQQQEPAMPSYRQIHGQDYAEYYRREEERALLARGAGDDAADEADEDARSTVTSLTAGMSRLEVDTYAETLTELGDQTVQRSTQVHGAYDFNHVDPTAAHLPIKAQRDEIVSKVNAFEVVVLEGRTGCGKTTQVPQYLLDEGHRLGRHANIIVTQPRRIAAVSVARRVARERNWPLGTLVGYEIGMDKKTGPDTRITYCTTGVLLQKIVHEGNMNQYTHVVLDEVHERDTDTDFALLLVRRLLRSTSRHVKVVLMSATFNTRLFAHYFAVPVQDRLDPAPVICVGPEEMYDVSVHYLAKLGPLLRDAAGDAGPRPELRSSWDQANATVPQIHPALYQLVVRLIKVINTFDVSDFGPSARYPRFGAQRGSVLVFLPGMHEIKELAAELEEHRIPERWQVMPLHSLITSDEQNTVFQQLPAEQRKIILSTNIAESSITVADVKYVIDFCMTKELTMDPETNYSMLKLSWASKANCLQRRGRAGRVSSGRVYRLVSQRFYEELPEYGVPEMLRSPLERVVIKAKKFCAESEPKAVLALALEPPQLEKIYSAVLHLKEVGALIDTRGAERFNPFDGELTVLGHVMSALPVDVNVARLLALGHAYGCLRECLIIGAGLTAKSFFARPFRDELRAYQMKVSWAGKSFSDCLAILTVYKVWEDCTRQGHFQRSGGRGEREWAEKNFIQLRCLKDMDALLRELERRLDACNIRPLPVRREQESEEERRQQALVLQVCIAGAFYPNYFLRLYREEREVDANRELGGRNPQTTVCLAGLPRDCGVLYYGQLLRQFRFNATDPDPTISFENSKAYVEFPVRRRAGDQGHAWEGDIPPAVYLAVRKGQIKNTRVTIMRYAPEGGAAAPGAVPGARAAAARRATQRAATSDAGRRQHARRRPARPLPPARTAQVRAAHESSRTAPAGRPQPARLYLAPYTEAGVTSLFRARVEAVGQRDCMVYFVDYGNTAEVRVADLLEFSPDMIKAGILEVVHGTIHVELFRKVRQGHATMDRSINKELVEAELAEHALEGYFSRQNHSEREARLVAPGAATLTTEALAAECTLSELKPTQAMAGRWGERAISQFQTLALYQHVIGHVYSVVHGTIHVELFRKVRQGHATMDRSINKELVEAELAEHALEGYFSRQNHSEREARCDRQPLRGPDSPLLLTLHGLPRSLHARPAFVDTDSCNSVLLDTEPQNPFDRLLVAAQVVPTSDGSRIRAQGTTMMPNIPGLPALLVLLFAPAVELRADQECTGLAGAVCGLGAEPGTGQAVYPDHDMEVGFDVAITTKDLVDVNVLRASFWMMYGGADAAGPEPHRLRDSDRRVAEQQEAERAELCRRVVELFTAARSVDVAEPHHCPLCEVTAPTPAALLAHINTEEHRRLALDLFADEEDGEEGE